MKFGGGVQGTADGQNSAVVSSFPVEKTALEAVAVKVAVISC